jgi:hypothetical protein
MLTGCAWAGRAAANEQPKSVVATMNAYFMQFS